MAVQGQRFTFTMQAKENLNSHQYQAIAFDDGKIANDSKEAVGVILNKPKDDHFVTCGYFGDMKFRAGAAISAGTRLRITTSGYFLTGNSGYYDCGRCLGAVTSGSIGRGLFDFTNPRYRVSSL